MSFNPALFTATNKPIGLTGTPVDARTYYYDTTYFVFRAYVDTAEVLAYLIGNNRTGQFSIIINTGGTLVNGVITGGTNAEWWFKDGIADVDLVLKSSGGGSTNTILNGTTAPSSGVGVDGDFYVDTIAWLIYGPKASGVWGSGTDIVGPPGTDGTDGTNGVGVPTGGATGQILAKIDGTNYNTDWIDPSAGGGDLLAANNLSDVASVNASRDNLGFQTIWNRKGTVLFASDPLDQGNIGEPTVIYEGSPQILTIASSVFKMWFGGGWSVPYIFYAESIDGVSWTRYATPVVTAHVRTFVFKNASTYYMYTANVANTQLDQYTSSDGVTWTLAHSGVVTAAGIGVDFTYSPFVFIESGTWKMMLECGVGLITPYGVTYYLTSADGVTWAQGASNPVVAAFTAGNPYVMKVGSTYWMYGHGTGVVGQDTTPSDIYRQSSPDLITWSAATLVFSRRSVDEGANSVTGQAADMSLLAVGNSMYLFYTATPDGTNQAGGAHIKLAVANMTLDQLVATTEGDGGDINVQPAPIIYDPIAKSLSFTGGSAATLTLNAPVNPYMQFRSNGDAVAAFVGGLSAFLTNRQDFSILANGSGNMSLEATNLYLNPPGTGSNLFLSKSGNFGLNTVAAYGTWNYSGANFIQQFIYATSQILQIANAGNTFISPQNVNDIVYSSKANQTFATISAFDQVDAFAEFNVTNKSLIINGGNSAGFSPDASAVLQVDNTTKGFLPPRMTTTQRNAISSPAEGLMVYDLTLHHPFYYNGSAWVQI